jgi:hypothetical protein
VIEKLIVAAIVIAALGMLVRSLMKVATGRGGSSCCTTSGCKSCKDLCRNVRRQ